MTRGGGSGDGKRGLLGWLIGRRGSAGAPAAASEVESPSPEPPVTEPPVEAAGYGTGAAVPTDASSGGEPEHDENELVLGPAYVAPAAEGGDGPREPKSSEAPGGQDRETGAEPDGSDEGLPEEEALVARLRAAGVEGAVGESALEREYRLPFEESPAGAPDPRQSAPPPEENGEADLSRLSGEERTEGEGELRASDPDPEGREPMEAPVTSRDDEADRKADPAGPDTEHAAEAVPLFPGEQASAEADARKNRQPADDTPDEMSDERPAEIPAEIPAETPAETTENAAEGTPGEAGTEAESEAEIEPEAESKREAVAETDPETDPETGPESGSGSEFESRAAAESLAESLAVTAPETFAEPDHEPDADSGEPAAAPTDAPALSEETVRRLIREELEGELGERMSANIRRMIREEVSHALLRQR